MAGFHGPVEEMGGGEDVLVDRPEPQAQQGLRKADGHERSVHLRGDGPLDGEEIGSLMRLFRRSLRAALFTEVHGRMFSEVGRDLNQITRPGG